MKVVFFLLNSTLTQTETFWWMDADFQDLQGSLWQSWELNHSFFHSHLLTVPVLPLESVICCGKAFGYYPYMWPVLLSCHGLYFSPSFSLLLLYSSFTVRKGKWRKWHIRGWLSCWKTCSLHLDCTIERMRSLGDYWGDSGEKRFLLGRWVKLWLV